MPVDTSALRIRLLREDATTRQHSREMAADALSTPDLTPFSRELFTETLRILDSLNNDTAPARPELPSTDQAAHRRAGGQPTSNQYGTFTVRHASDRQAAFLRNLFTTRDTTGVQDTRNRALLNRAATELSQGKVALTVASDVIDILKNCPVADHPDARAEHERLTERQEWFIRQLTSSRDTTHVNLPEDLSTIPRADASRIITALKAAPRAARPVPGTPAVTEGMYLADGRIFKVQKSRESGRLYAKELVDGSFVYAQGAMRLLQPGHRMTLEEAKKYGALYGTCCVCSRTLTDENSIAAGIGPICAGKTSWA